MKAILQLSQISTENNFEDQERQEKKKFQSFKTKRGEERRE